MSAADFTPLMHRRFFALSEENPSRPAVSFRESGQWISWTYGELALCSRAIAKVLQSQGIKPQTPVAVASHRHPLTIAAMIAILEVGGHYVPLDLNYPAPRLRFLCEQANVPCALSAHPVTAGLLCVPAINLARFARPEALTASSNEDRPSLATCEHSPAQSPAYILFTSGSTGEPKGVVVPHQAVIRLIDHPHFMRLDSSRAMLWLAPLGFDASTLEIWGPLLNGGRCVIYPEGQLPTAALLKETIRSTQVNALWLTSSLFNNIVDQDPLCFEGVEDLLTGGEALSVPHVVKALGALKSTQLINGYGPTENTTFTTCYRIPADFAKTEPRVPIGEPISGTEVAIVDERLQPVPDGVEGELIALGEGLALGYLNLPQLTRERFVEIELGQGTLVRGYRTGDRVVRRPDGLIDYLGRFDDQVKIDGHRIEPGEVERVLAGLAGVNDCRVLAMTAPSGQKRLVAYIVANEEIREQNLKERLAGLLPAFMVPHHLMYVDALPINANGKLDRAALPDPFRPNPTQDQLVMLVGTATREAALIAEGWQVVLGQKAASPDLNFFDAGGSSLDAVKLLEWLEKRLGRALEPTFVFAHATIRRQADALLALERSRTATASRGELRRLAQAQRIRGSR